METRWSHQTDRQKRQVLSLWATAGNQRRAWIDSREKIRVALDRVLQPTTTMDPARTRKLTKKVDKQQQQQEQQEQKPSGSFRQQRPSNPPHGTAAGRPPRAGAPPSKITSLPSFNAAKKGSFPAQTPLPSSYAPARPPPRESRPPPPAKAVKPKDASLKLTTLTKPLPSLGAYPNLVRLDLSSIEGGLEGVGAGWIGKEFGSQLTWLSLAGCEGLARTHDWEGFELLTGLVGE